MPLYKSGFLNGGSTYITDRKPDKYGGNQDSYVANAQSAIRKAVSSFQTTIAEKKDLTELFQTTISALAMARNREAIKQHSDDAPRFGNRRDAPSDFWPNTITNLSPPYDEYSARLLPILQKHLASMTDANFKITKEKIVENDSSIEFTIFRNTTIPNWIFPYTEEKYKEICKLCDIPPKTDAFKGEYLIGLIADKSAMQTLKRVSIENYNRLKITEAIIQTIDTYKIKNNPHWVLATLYSETEGEKRELSQYLTWVSSVCDEDPIDHMTNNCVVTIMHQDPLLIDKMLHDAGKLFKDALECDGKNPTKLKEVVAGLLHGLSHAMPFDRGSAAIFEWLEIAIYDYHGYDLSYATDKMVNLEALISPLATFIKNYDSMIQLHPHSTRREPLKAF